MSVLWVLFVANVTAPWRGGFGHDPVGLLAVGIIPVVLVWGVVRIIQGFRR